MIRKMSIFNNLRTYLVIKVNRLPDEIDVVTGVRPVNYGPYNVLLDLAPALLLLHHLLDYVVSVAVYNAVHFVVWVRFFNFCFFIGVF